LYLPIPTFSEAVQAEFWKLVQKHGDDECWQWLGVVNCKYGRWKGFMAHRAAYTMLVGPIPEGLTIDHLCRNQLCVNPAHLEPVTQSVNTRRYTATLPLVCCHGHQRERGKACKKCNVAAVAATMRKYPEKYQEMRRLQKRKERARKREALAIA
jgi:hypothetical protein